MVRRQRLSYVKNQKTTPSPYSLPLPPLWQGGGCRGFQNSYNLSTRYLYNFL